MKDVLVIGTWTSRNVIEVPDDFDTSLALMEWPEEYLEQVSSQCAELVDWDVR